MAPILRLLHNDNSRKTIVIGRKTGSIKQIYSQSLFLTGCVFQC